MDELEDIKDRLASIAVLIAAVLLVGTWGYRIVEGWPFFDSLYMTVITLATVGYGEVHTLDHAGRAFTIFLIMGGIGVMTYAFSAITSVIVDGKLSAALRRRSMEKDIAKLSGHYVVCGGGHAGGVIIAELRRIQRAFVLVEREPDIIQKMRERQGAEIPHVVGDATDDETLRAAGVERAAGVFAVLATDQDNAFVALSAKGLNPGLRVVSCQKELGVRAKLMRSGADNVVNPEYIGGLRMASEMIRPATVGFLDSMMRESGTVERFDEIAVPEGSPYVGKPVGEVKGSEGNGPLLIAVLDGQSKKYDINPDSARPIRAGDSLVMVGEVGRLAELRKRFGAAG
ncbi:MAG: NAD-binding protein [Elusimicrobia bacterium]|nr:NAD-binding protein [Elusimicrobiota bacterium]